MYRGCVEILVGVESENDERAVLLFFFVEISVHNGVDCRWHRWPSVT